MKVVNPFPLLFGLWIFLVLGLILAGAIGLLPTKWVFILVFVPIAVVGFVFMVIMGIAFVGHGLGIDWL